MTSLVVHTARVSYGGPDRLDVTAKSAGEEGRAFAPRWGLVRWGLDMMERAKKKRALGEPGAEAFAEWAWHLYSMRYTAQMRLSFVEQPKAWERLLARRRVVLVCYCTDPERCHRRVLAHLLEQAGAVDAGELPESEQRGGPPDEIDQKRWDWR